MRWRLKARNACLNAASVTVMLAGQSTTQRTNEKPHGCPERIVFMSSYGILGGMFCALVLGCATAPSPAMSDTAKKRARMERQEQLERDWRLSRDHGRIGYVGNQAPRWRALRFLLLEMALNDHRRQ